MKLQENIKKISSNITTEYRKRITLLTLLSIWTLILFSSGNKIYGLIIIAILLILIIPRPQYFMLLAISVLIIVLFNTSTANTWTMLINSNLTTYQNPSHALSIIFKPNSGQEVLPIQVQQMLSLLRIHHIVRYQLSTQLDQDPLIMQRIIEAAWPIEMDIASPYLLSSFQDLKNHSTCVVIDQREDVVLANCH